MFNEKYDVIVVGAGYAGSEAAAASANMGSSTFLVTMSLQNIAQCLVTQLWEVLPKAKLLKRLML